MPRIFHAAQNTDLHTLSGQRSYLLDLLGTAPADPESRAALGELVHRYNRRAPVELRIAGDVLHRTIPARQAPPARPAPAPRAAERRQDPIIERLQDIWDGYREEYFKGKLPAVEIAFENVPGREHLFGSFSPTERRVRLHPGLFTGEHRSLAGGSRDREGLVNFACDVLLHEAIHAHEFYLRGRCTGHEDFFHAQCVRITKKLTPVRRAALYWLTRENCKVWPDMVRRRKYYRGVFQSLCRL